jgi:hypothetical protein
VGWTWITGEPWSFELWATGAPGGPANEHYVYMTDQFHWGAPSGYWDDCPWGYGGSPMAVIEWDADCNNDGIVDYGQIKSGQLADDNTNGIPDICEASVTGVVPPSVPAQGGSAITIKGNNFPENPSVLVGGLPATDVVRVSATRITAATPSLLPGMASVKVNSFTLEEALYIRPQCGSDLDQNGSVDAGDISIILLDFGPCYEPPAALAVPAPTPLLVDEPAQKTGTAKKE